jgi:hypothetical protein
MPELNGEELCVLFTDALKLLDAELTRCERAFGLEVVASHFRLGPLTVKQWKKFHLVHGKHHLAQLDRIEKATRGSATR